MPVDPFPRRTATPAALVPWAIELARNARGLIGAYAAGGALDARSREELILAVTDVSGCRFCAWAHTSWAGFLGDIDGEAAPEPARGYAASSTGLGRPDDPGSLAEELGEPLARSVRATVALANVLGLVGNTVDGLLARATGKRPAEPARATVELATIAGVTPVALSLLGVAAVLGAVARVAPPRTGVRVSGDDAESNLLVHVLSEALAPLDANAALRLVVARSPFTAVIGVRAGLTSATVRVGNGKLALENGLAPDAWVVVESDVGPLLRLAARPVVRDLAHIRVRPA